MPENEKTEPVTYGELRKRLEAAGNPWTPDPTKADEEPLPEFQTGGDGNYEPEDRTLKEGGVDEVLLKGAPPASPDLQAEWREEGLLPDESIEMSPTKRPKGKKPAETPAPDMGG